MGDYLTKGTTYTDGGTVNAANLNALVDDSVMKPTAISNRTDAGVPGGAVEFLVNDGGTLKKVTETNLATAIAGASLVHGKAAVTTLSDLDEFLVWEDGVAAERKITLANLRPVLFPSGSVIQGAYGEYTTSANLSSTLPDDDTIPQITEGTQIISVAITPKFTTSKVLLQFTGAAYNSTNDASIVVAVFRVGSAGALGGIYVSHNENENAQRPQNVAFQVQDSPATISAVTYTIRAGPGGGGSIRFNGTGSRVLGGAQRAALQIWEIAA